MEPKAASLTSGYNFKTSVFQFSNVPALYPGSSCHWSLSSQSSRYSITRAFCSSTLVIPPFLQIVSVLAKNDRRLLGVFPSNLGLFVSHAVGIRKLATVGAVVDIVGVP